MTRTPILLMVAGPYRAPNEQQRAENLRALHEAALQLFRAGYIPIVGVDLALPLISAGGSYDEVMMPLSLSLGARCDAVLRIGGVSLGADQEVERFRAAGKPVYTHLSELLSQR